MLAMRSMRRGSLLYRIPSGKISRDHDPRRVGATVTVTVMVTVTVTVTVTVYLFLSGEDCRTAGLRRVAAGPWL